MLQRSHLRSLPMRFVGNEADRQDSGTTQSRGNVDNWAPSRWAALPLTDVGSRPEVVVAPISLRERLDATKAAFCRR